MQSRVRLLLGLVVGLIPSWANAAFVTFDDQASFLAATGASATAPYENIGEVPGGVDGTWTFGAVTFSIVSPSVNLHFGRGPELGDWSAVLPGVDIAIGGAENLDAAFASPVYSAGFDFIEIENGPQLNAGAGQGFVDSTFSVTLKSGSAARGTFTFNAPSDVASFVGVWSDAPFDRLEIRETVGAAENEFFGQFYSGTLAIPEPESYAMLMAGLGLLGFAARRRRALRSAM